ncbi:hypothetical protein B0H63DRAFT_539138 [Podospora didyma]|uniref:Ribosomal RNA methyltransferase FtsJ domain-containing protein n=1 Tax=Podospora didyma TaxID=330526 RepID=A0AAE0U4J2_9PEZI|nr:hypothetical protein B0H63DRAFT_539138 [Podospora didyma]
MHDTNSDGPDTSTAEVDARNALRQYIEENAPDYKELVALKRQGWQDDKADEHFQRQRTQAATADETTKNWFFAMTLKAGRGLKNMTCFISGLAAEVKDRDPMVLDLGMAPGGFRATVREILPNVQIRGVSLPVCQGGYEVRVPGWETDSNMKVEFLDITMVAEMGMPDLDASGTMFSHARLFSAKCSISPSAVYQQLFKVAQAVQADEVACRGGRDVEEAMTRATLVSDDNEETASQSMPSLGDVEEFIAGFGPRLIRLGNPVWKVQVDTLRKAPWKFAPSMQD